MDACFHLVQCTTFLLLNIALGKFTVAFTGKYNTTLEFSGPKIDEP